MGFHELWIDRVNPSEGAYLITSPMSSFWKDINKDVGCVKLLKIVPYYILGMVGFAVCLPIRIVNLVPQFFKLIGSFFSFLFNPRNAEKSLNFKSELLASLFTIGEIFSAVLGIVCPILAYKVDEFFQDFQFFQAKNCLTSLCGEQGSIWYASERQGFVKQAKIVPEFLAELGMMREARQILFTNFLDEADETYPHGLAIKDALFGGLLLISFFEDQNNNLNLLLNFHKIDNGKLVKDNRKKDEVNELIEETKEIYANIKQDNQQFSSQLKELFAYCLVSEEAKSNNDCSLKEGHPVTDLDSLDDNLKTLLANLKGIATNLSTEHRVLYNKLQLLASKYPL